MVRVVVWVGPGLDGVMGGVKTRLGAVWSEWTGLFGKLLGCCCIYKFIYLDLTLFKKPGPSGPTLA
jgi:hypothetical protein